MLFLDKRKGRDRGLKTSYIEQANKKKFCLRLTWYLQYTFPRFSFHSHHFSFITLVDYMMINMMQTVITNSTNDIVDGLHAHLLHVPPEEKLCSTELDVTLEDARPEGAPQTPFFLVDVVLEPTELSLDPSRKVTKDIFRQVVNLWEDDLTAVRSLIGDNIYNPFTKYFTVKLLL